MLLVEFSSVIFEEILSPLSYPYVRSTKGLLLAHTKLKSEVNFLLFPDNESHLNQVTSFTYEKHAKIINKSRKYRPDE